MKAVGAFNGPLHFIGDDQARTSVEQNANEGAPMACCAEPGAGVMSNDPCKHRRPHGVVIEGTAPDAHSSGDCCFLSGRKHHPNRRCSCVKSQLCLCHCVAIHSTAHFSFARHLPRLKAPQPVPPARIVIRHGGRAGRLHENCRRDGGTDGSTIRGEGFGRRPSPNHGRNHDGEDRRVESAKDGGVSFLKSRGTVHKRPSWET